MEKDKQVENLDYYWDILQTAHEQSKQRYWSEYEKKVLDDVMKTYGLDWHLIAKKIPTKSLA